MVTVMAEQSVKRKAKKEKWYLRDISSDIKYLGPLSYRHFKIFGWICLAVGQIGVMLSMVSGSGISVPAQFAPIQTITSAVGQLALVFFLIGNFSIILDDSDGYQRVLIVNGISTAAVIAAFFILYYRYILGVIEIFSGDRENAVQAVNQMLSTTHGFSAFNLFIIALFNLSVLHMVILP